MNKASQRVVKATLQEDRGYWRIKGRVFDPASGKMKQRSHSTGLRVKDNTKRIAEQMLRDVVAQWTAEQDQAMETLEAGPSFMEYVQKWIDRKKASGIKANTAKSYEDYIGKHIKPKLGNIPIRQMKLRDLEQFFEGYLVDHKVESARKVLVVIKGALHEAIREDVIQYNFAGDVEFPREKKFKGAAYNEEQVKMLLDAVKQAGEPIRAAVVLAVCYGLRRSEALGLRWKDIDFEKKTLTVRNTVVQNGELRIESEETKTKKSNRTIGLLDATIPYLKELKKKQEEAGIALDKVCIWPDGREVRPDYITKHVMKLMKKAGLPVVRFHDLRHTAATILAPHVTTKQLQEFLGHEDVSMTLGTYTHILDEQKIATSLEMNAVLERAKIFS